MRFSIVSILLFFSIVSYAQGFDLSNYEDLSETVMLPRDGTTTFVQDNEGFAWVGTWKGLFRYDGYKSVNFNLINKNFSGQKITSLFRASDGRIWVACFIDGVYVIDPKTYKVQHYSKEAKDAKFRISDDNIIAIGEAQQGEIWFGCESFGLDILKPQRVENLSMQNSGLISNQVSTISVDWTGNVWIGTGSGICVMNMQTHKISVVMQHECNKFVYQIVFTPDKQVFVAHKMGLHIYDPMKGTSQELLKESCTSIYIKPTPHGAELMIGALDGIYTYSSTNKILEHRSTRFAHSALKNQINSIYGLADGTVLVGTMRGSFLFMQSRKEFRNFPLLLDSNIDVSVSSISTAGNNFWVGTWGDGLFFFDPKLGLYKRIRTNIPNFDGYIYDAVEYKGKLWISTKNIHGVFGIPLSAISDYFIDKSEAKFYGNETNPTLLGANVITRMYKGTDTELLLGSWEGQIFKYNSADDSFETMIPKDHPEFENYPIRSLIRDNKGALWVGTSGKGVVQISNDTMRCYNKAKGLSDNLVTQIYISTNGIMWVGTENGINAIWPDGRIESFLVDSRLQDVQSIIEDSNGFIWVGTSTGLVMMNSNNEPSVFKYFNTKDGLVNNSFFHHASCTNSNTEILLGGNNGIDMFDPHKINFNYLKPKAKLTDIFLFGKRISEGMNLGGRVVLHTTIGNTNQITLNFDQNTIELDFANLQYILPEKASYTYKLDGVDVDWNTLSGQLPKAIYTNLRWGTYKFWLKSCNNDGFWSEPKMLLTIVITPPWWATYYAFGIYIAIVILLLLFFNKRTIVKVKHLHSIELKELAYEKQMEVDEAKLRFFTNISHELRTPLTLIIGPLARIIERENEDKLREQHLLMFRNADRLLKLITRLMDFSKDEQSKLVLQVRKGSIIPTVENVFLSFRFEALHNLIDYQFITNKPIPELWFDNEFVESILFNLISNAFKYTPTNKAVIVHIDKETVDNKPYLCIRISDQGKGISASSLERVFDRFYSGDKLHAGTGIGLSFTKRLVDLHHGLIKVSSELDIGSVFSVLLPLTDVYLVEEKEQAAFQRKEMVINWKKIDSHVASNALESFSRLKQDFEKDQLIALIVDDNADVRIFISDILFENFEVVLAENAEVGFRIASEIIPDIIISDVMMPGMNGFQFCEKLKKDQRTDHIPVILTTVLSSQEDRIEGLRWGADSFIPKPLDPEHLMIRVRKLLERQEKLKKKYQTTVEINATNSGIPQASHETENPQDPFVVEATLCILKNIEKSDFTVDDLCRTIGMSRMQLYRKLKAVTGLSANTFIRKIRLKRAAELLATGKYSVKEVTYDVGFSDLKYFRKCFKEEFGVNPSGYGNEKEDD